MKKNLVLFILAIFSFIACSKNEVISEGTNSYNSISFSTYVGKSVQTKATSIYTDNIAESGIGLLAWKTGDQIINEDILNDVPPKFMQNIKLTWAKSGDNFIGSYKPERYWPSNGEMLSFFAYAPYSDGKQSLTNDFHPENITFDPHNSSAHLLTLTVPKNEGAANTGVEYSKHTDFMVARKGNGINNTGIDENDINVGINQNLNKSYNDAVKLQMKHALSKISFVARSTEGNKSQDEPYSNGLVKVVFDNIKINGSFAGKGTYNLFDESWTVLSEDNHNEYNLVNTEGVDNDPFNPIADEVYNIQKGNDVENETNTPDEDGWYKLNKSSHDLMIIPYINNNGVTTSAQITGITGTYIVKTYEKQLNSLTGEYELIEIVDYRDIVNFDVKFEGDQAIYLQEGKAYEFQFNIFLKKIDFSVVVEEWSESHSNVIDNSGSEIITSTISDLSASEINFSYEDSENTVSFYSSADWIAKVIDTKSVSDWLSVEPTSGSVGNAEINIIAKQNNTSQVRKGEIVITAGNTNKSIEVIQNPQLSYYITDDNDAIITSDGYYAMLKPFPESNDYIFIIGDSNSNSKSYMLIDEKGYLKGVDFGNGAMYSVLYTSNSLLFVNSEGNVQYNFPYTSLSSDNNEVVITKALTEYGNPLWNNIKLISEIANYVQNPAKKLAMNVIRVYLEGEYGRHGSELADLLDLILDPKDLVAWGELFNRINENCYFGNANIITGDAVENGMVSYKLPATVSGFRRFNLNNQLYVLKSLSYTLVMESELNSTSESEDQKQEKEISGDGTYNFNFTFDKLSSSYDYRAALVMKLSYETLISEEAYYRVTGLAPGSTSWTPDPQLHYKTMAIVGNVKSLYTNNVGTSILSIENITKNSADLICTFTELPSGATCGVEYTDDKGNKYQQTSSVNPGKNTITITSLKAATSYTCTTFIQYNGKTYYSTESKSFKTNFGDIVGSWSCTEISYTFSGTPIYDTYNITIKEDGTVHSSSFNEIIRSSWRLSATGDVLIEIVDLATITVTSGKDWSGKVDDLSNPTKISGSTYRWNANQNGSFNGEPKEFIMTR